MEVHADIVGCQGFTHNASRNRHLTTGPRNLLFSAVNSDPESCFHMSIGRTILALLIALSVAMLPAVAGAGISVKSADMNVMSAMEDMPDCCPHKANPCDRAMDGCTSMAACALKCFSFAGTSFSNIVFPSSSAKMPASIATNPFSSQTGSPPFRPPRV
jgi:hypothetical protein